MMLIVQIVVAAAIYFAGRYFGAPWWQTAVLLVVGVVGVHAAWGRLFGGPVHLGARAIAEDDPLMIDAHARAKATWPRFVGMYPEHRQDAIVKYRLRAKDGEIENVWGDLLELGEREARVYLRTPPVGDVELADRTMTIPVDDIVDWQIMMQDGSLRGGFTQQATFRIYEREEGHLPRGYAEQLARYREL